MKRYLVVFHGESAVRIGGPLPVSLPGFELEIHERPTQDRQVYPVPMFDWTYEAYLDARTGIGAINAATRNISFFADQIAFLSRAAVGDPKPFVALSLDDGPRGKELVQVLYESEATLRSRRPFDTRLLRTFLIDGIEGSDREKLRPSVERALNLFRRSLLESDPCDRFQDLWAALEALNPAMRAHYGVSRNYQVTCSNSACKSPIACPACGKMVNQVDSSSGMHHLITSRMGRGSDWPDLRKSRVNIVHALTNEGVLGEDLQAKVGILFSAVRVAILDLLRVESCNGNDADPPLSIDSAPKFLVRATIDLPTAPLAPSKGGVFPHFKPTITTSDTGKRPATDTYHAAQLELDSVGFDRFLDLRLEALVQRGPNDDAISGFDQPRPDAARSEACSPNPPTA